MDQGHAARGVAPMLSLFFSKW